MLVYWYVRVLVLQYVRGTLVCLCVVLVCSCYVGILVCSRVSTSVCLWYVGMFVCCVLKCSSYVGILVCSCVSMVICSCNMSCWYVGGMCSV